MYYEEDDQELPIRTKEVLARRRAVRRQNTIWLVVSATTLFILTVYAVIN